MKKTLLTTALMCLAVGVFGQGQVNFGNNLGASTFRAAIYGPDTANPALELHGQTTGSLSFPQGTTVYTGGRLDGSRYKLELMAGYSEAQMRSVGVFDFLSGTSAGFITTRAAFVLPIGFDVGTKPLFEVRAWDSQSGASYDAATIKGHTGVFNPNITLGGIDSSGNPLLPANLTGYTSFNIHGVVPEPSTIALGVLGLGSLLLFRRKKA